MLAVECIIVGELQTNSYIVFDTDSRVGIIIDAGGDAEWILSAVKRNEIEVAGIYLTHGHFDHVLAADDLKRELGCKVYLHRFDLELLKHNPEDVRLFLGKHVHPPPDLDEYVSDGDVIDVGKYRCKVIHTPGHTPGSVCYVFDGLVFVGDTLFAGSIGRTDLYGGNLNQLIHSVTKKLFAFPDNYMVYPGHGPSTLIGVERSLNPFVGKRGLLTSRGI